MLDKNLSYISERIRITKKNVTLNDAHEKLCQIIVDIQITESGPRFKHHPLSLAH